MKEWKELLDALMETQEMQEYRSFAQIFFVALAVSVIVALVLYIFKAISVYRMATSAGIPAPWLAFVPIANLYTFGRLAETAGKQDGTKTAKFGALLLFMDLIRRILAALIVLLLLLRISDVFYHIENITAEDIVRKAIPILFILFLVAGIAIAQTIIRYVALYRIFTVFSYQNAKMYTLLSVLGMFFLSDILEPIFLFLVRKNTPVFDYRERLIAFTENVKPDEQ